VARVPAAELDADWTRRIITPALLVLALLLAGLALALIALKRWIIEPMRELDRGLIASAARVAVADGLPAEWQSLRGRAAARDEAWAEAVKLRDVLVNEVNHRVANTLQMVVSLLRLHDAALARADPSQAGAILREAQDRVSTIAVVHRQLRAAAAGGVDDVRKLLWSIADTLVAGFGMSDRVSVTVDATPVPLRAEEAVTLGLLLNEWVTNSLKYAYPDGRQGVIRIALHIDGRDMVLDYADGGVGAGEHRREGLGTAITAGLTRQLQGSLERLSGRGEAYRLRFPMRA
jgi:two-component sensor histidine kinase